MTEGAVVASMNTKISLAPGQKVLKRLELDSSIFNE